MSAPPRPPRLAEGQVSNAFHAYLTASLTQANTDSLLDKELLASAEADLMITGPALCLYFAALRCTTNPPSVPLPRSALFDKSGPPIDLTIDNCPRPFIGFLHTWANTVPLIQALDPAYQHDLARIICSLEPRTSPLHPDIARIAAELRAVAIEISQRRSFQDRYAGDLQAALDAGDGPGDRTVGRRVASFQPPPMYEPSPSPSTSSPHRSPASPNYPLPPLPETANGHGPQDPTLLSPTTSTFPSSSTATRTRTPSPSGSSRSAHSPTPASPSFTADAPALQLIRETLYASLADTLVRSRHIKRLLRTDPPKAYFAAVSLAILDVSLTRTRTFQSQSQSQRGAIGEETEVTGVLGATLTLAMCPRPLQPFMRELGAIGAAARAAEDEDTAAALRALTADPGARQLPTPRMERVRRMLERGIGAVGPGRRRRGPAGEGASSTDDDDDETDDADEGEDEEGGRRRSVEGRAIALANRINALALGMTKLKPFRERQEEVFAILASVSS